MNSRTFAYAALLAGAVLGLIAASQGRGLSSALAVAGLAGALLLLALRARGRQVAGVALALLGVGMTLAGLMTGSSGWPIAYAAAGALIVVGAVVTIFTSPRWPSRPDRFRTYDEPVDLWRAQDAGLDPTADAAGPDVRKTPSGGTMKSAEHSQRPSRRK